MGNERLPGHTGDYTWCDFFVGRFKLELIESAAPGSFVERFIAKRGEGLHHLSIEAPDFDAVVAALERGGVRIVDRFDAGAEGRTAFISPRSAFGTLIQFWSAFEDEPPRAGRRRSPLRRRGRPAPGEPRRDRGARDRARPRLLPRDSSRSRPAGAAARGYEPSFRFTNFFLDGYKIELIEQNPAAPDGFVAEFLRKRGEGFHHVAIHVDRLAPILRSLERDGVRITARTRLRDGRETAFISPRSAFGVAIQFWEHPDLGAAP